MDRQVEAAWGSTSREEPPEALDASIRAAAHRAVAARPGRAKPASWWRVKTHWIPVAAAAVMAVLAVGLVELTPPEQVNPASTADRSMTARPLEQVAIKPAAPAASTTGEMARADESSAQLLAQERADQLERKRPAQQAVNAAAEKKRTPFPAPSPTAERQPPAKSDAAAATPSETESSEASRPRVARAEPFPAAARVAVRSDSVSTTPATTSRREASPAASAAAAVPATAAPAAALRGTGPESKGKLESPETTQSGMARLAAPDRLRSQDAAPRSADEWIKLIRRLRAEGKSEEAAKELAAFRSAYRERAQELLPADLREIKP